MRVTSVTPADAEIIETDEKEWPTYRRSSGGHWENLMGESWEYFGEGGRLEAAYQAFITRTTSCLAVSGDDG